MELLFVYTRVAPTRGFVAHSLWCLLFRSYAASRSLWCSKVPIFGVRRYLLLKYLVFEGISFSLVFDGSSSCSSFSDSVMRTKTYAKRTSRRSPLPVSPPRPAAVDVSEVMRKKTYAKRTSRRSPLPVSPPRPAAVDVPPPLLLVLLQLMLVKVIGYGRAISYQLCAQKK
ncbi:hypothetical protein ACS0TY_029758 [Phlomoides rotata]